MFKYNYLSDENDVDLIRTHITMCLKFLSMYRYLSNSYIIEFFVKKHWDLLPNSWQCCLNNRNPLERKSILGSITSSCCVNNNVPSSFSTLPLSLLAFKVAAKHLSIPRVYCEDKNVNTQKCLDHVYRKHVGPKKQHEIYFLSEYISQTLQQAGCSKVIDFGSGQGHLARLLTLGYKIDVFAVETEKDFLSKASIFDKEAVVTMNKSHFNNTHETSETPVHQFATPVHIQKRVNKDSIIESLLPCSEDDDMIETKSFLLTGLHACGDLSTTMLRMFVKNEQVKAIVSVACCYMKLTTDESFKENNANSGSDVASEHLVNGYPMSNFVSTLPNHILSYKTLEASCHAYESYFSRLHEDALKLKIHCYRATLESLIRYNFPHLVRPPVQTIKKAYLLPFSEYAKKAFEKLKLPYHEDMFSDENKLVTDMLLKWNDVVTFYSLSLQISPVVETVILLDRILFLLESGHNASVVQLFQPELSPRCFAVVSVKQ